MAAALGALIEHGRAEIIDPPRVLKRNARKVASDAVA
jgi:hypothetical protein